MRSLFILLFLAASQFVIAQKEKPFIVVELFTSEGCSSCPPADRLLSSVIEGAAPESAEIMGLSFHVDHWDYIGWKDPYAAKDYTLRQRAYGRKFKLNSIYTPQMIVNGKHEFVGSSQRELDEAIRLESSASSHIPLAISIKSKTAETLSFKVSSTQSVDAQLNVAIVEKNLTQQVSRGENRGRKLAHDNVVRAFDMRSFDGQENHFSLKIPEDLKEEDASLIVYIQSSDNWHVVGAERIPFHQLK